jgi:hypothetical protein
MDDTKNMMISYSDAVLHHWGKILLCLSTGILLGYMAYSTSPVEWESEAVVQIGKLGLIGPQSDETNELGLPIESLQNVVERLKSPAFFEGIAQKAESLDFREVTDVKYGGNGMLSVQKIRSSNVNSNLILLKLRAKTAELAKLKLDLIVKELNSLHYKIGFEYLDVLRTELADGLSQTNSLKQTAIEIDKRILGSGCFDMADANIGKCSILLSSKSSTSRALLENADFILSIKTALSSPNTVPTNAIESPTLPVQPISSSLLQMLMLGLLVGLASSVIWIAILRNHKNH